MRLLTDLPDAWKKWIIENKLLNVPDQSLIEAMVQNGIDRQIAIQAINNVITDASDKNTQVKAQEKGINLQNRPLTHEIVENTDAAYLVDQIFKDEILIISFAFVAWHNLPQFDFYGRTKKLANLAQKSINRILLRDVSNTWYHRGIPGLGTDINEVAHSLKQLIKKISPSKVITIGQSMGAYAAIMFGQLIGVDKVLAFGTLSFLHSQKAKEIGDSRWLSVMKGLEADLPKVYYLDLLELCQTSPHSPDIQIFYGKKPDSDTPGKINLDDFHAKRMNLLSNCTIRAYEEAGHAIVQYLINQDLIDSLLLEAVFDIKKAEGEEDTEKGDALDTRK